MGTVENCTPFVILYFTEFSFQKIDGIMMEFFHPKCTLCTRIPPAVCSAFVYGNSKFSFIKNNTRRYAGYCLYYIMASRDS